MEHTWKKQVEEQVRIIWFLDLNDLEFEKALNELKQDFIEPLRKLMGFEEKIKMEFVMFREKKMQILNDMETKLHSIVVGILNVLKNS